MFDLIFIILLIINNIEGVTPLTNQISNAECYDIGSQCVVLLEDQTASQPDEWFLQIPLGHTQAYTNDEYIGFLPFGNIDNNVFCHISYWYYVTSSDIFYICNGGTHLTCTYKANDFTESSHVFADGTCGGSSNQVWNLCVSSTVGLKNEQVAFAQQAQSSLASMIQSYGYTVNNILKSSSECQINIKPSSSFGFFVVNSTTINQTLIHDSNVWTSYLNMTSFDLYSNDSPSGFLITATGLEELIKINSDVYIVHKHSEAIYGFNFTLNEGWIWLSTNHVVEENFEAKDLTIGDRIGDRIIIAKRVSKSFNSYNLGTLSSRINIGFANISTKYSIDDYMTYHDIFWDWLAWIHYMVGYGYYLNLRI